MEQNLFFKISQVLSKSESAKKEVLSKYHSIRDEDPYSSVIHIHSVLYSTYLSLVHYEENLCNENWWSEKTNQGIYPYDDVAIQKNNYLLFIGWSGLILLPFSHFEIGIRKIKNHENIFNAYKCLVTEMQENNWKFTLGNPFELFDLVRLTRNTIHNNGLHTKENRQIFWKGKEHNFKTNERRDFNFYDCVDLLEDLIQLNLEIMLNYQEACK